MKVIQTSIPDLLILEPKVFEDQRGFFLESWNQRSFDEVVGRHVNFVQDNHSRSQQGVLRGLHYQIENAQGKLVRVTQGKVFDVAVDLRKNSSSFGQYVGVELSEKNKRSFWIPPGFAHGFFVLSERADFSYKTTDYYNPKAECAILWSDSEIGIEWPFVESGLVPSVSEKDARGVAFKEALFFE